MLKLSDRVKQSSITIGTGNVVFHETFASFQSFADAIGNGNTTYYTIENNSNFEVGIGTYNSSGNYLSRDIILRSSNNNQKISLDGVSIVFCTYPADYSFFLNEQGFASGQMPAYSGIAFPNGLIQYGPINGSGIPGRIPYWQDATTLTSDAGFVFDNTTYTLNVSGAAIFDSDVTVRGDFNVFGTQTIVNTEISNTQIDQSTLTNTIFYRTVAGCFFHAYVDNAYDNMVALYSTNEASPTWKLGLKEYSPSFISAPSVGYVAGNNGSAGIYATDQNYAKINYVNGFWVTHRSVDIVNASKLTGTYIYNQTASVPALTVRGAAAQSENLQEWQTYTSDVVASISADGQVLCSSLKFSSDNSIQSKAYTENYRNLSSSTALLPTDDVVFIDTSIFDIELTLPSAENLGGKKIIVKRTTGNNSLIILPSGSQTIDSVASLAINFNNQSVTLISNNSNWYII